MSSSIEINQRLDQLRELKGDERTRALKVLVAALYSELKELARSNRYRWKGHASFGTTSLVHEAYARLAEHQQARPRNRRQFYALASTVMRNLLIDQARAYQRAKRGGGQDDLPLEEGRLLTQERSEDLLALDEALGQLEIDQPRLARVVECRCFGGLSVEETAEALELSPATVKRRWALARGWLYRVLSPSTPSE